MSDHRPDEDEGAARDPTTGVDTSGAYDRLHSNETLVVRTGPDAGQTAELAEGELLIGRSSDADLRLSDSGISGRHCRVVRDGDTTAIEDLDSSNGTIVNGEFVDDRRELTEGDAIALGEQTLARYTGLDDVSTDGASADDPSSATGTRIAVGREAYWFRVESAAPVDLRQRGALRRIFRALLEESGERSPLSTHDLWEIGWPDEPDDAEPATNRVYWAINKLRETGLRGLLITSDRGYFLPDALVAVERHDHVRPPDDQRSD